MTCKAKHVYEPEEWACPKCGSDRLIIDWPDEKADHDCGLTHTNDFLVCDECEWEGYGYVATRMWKKQDSTVVCECCNGKGYVVKK